MGGAAGRAAQVRALSEARAVRRRDNRAERDGRPKGARREGPGGPIIPVPRNPPHLRIGRRDIILLPQGPVPPGQKSHALHKFPRPSHFQRVALATDVPAFQAAPHLLPCELLPIRLVLEGRILGSLQPAVEGGAHLLQLSAQPNFRSGSHCGSSCLILSVVSLKSACCRIS